jgi:hypothetical protein
VPVVSIKPEDAEAHFGWLANFVKLDVPSSSIITRQKLNWKPSGPGLIADLDNMYYSRSEFPLHALAIRNQSLPWPNENL